MASNPSAESQIAGLNMIVEECKGWHAMLLINRPGDVPFITGISPALRGYEIVCYTGEYDIWKQPKRYPSAPQMVETNLSVEDVVEWIKKRSPTEKEFLRHAEKWFEETMVHYRIPKKGVASMGAAK